MQVIQAKGAALVEAWFHPRCEVLDSQPSVIEPSINPSSVPTQERPKSPSPEIPEPEQAAIDGAGFGPGEEPVPQFESSPILQPSPTVTLKEDMQVDNGADIVGYALGYITIDDSHVKSLAIHEARVTPNEEKVTPSQVKVTPNEIKVTPTEVKVTPNEAKVTPQGEGGKGAEGGAQTPCAGMDGNSVPEDIARPRVVSEKRKLVKIARPDTYDATPIRMELTGRIVNPKYAHRAFISSPFCILHEN